MENIFNKQEMILCQKYKCNFYCSLLMFDKKLIYTC